MTDPQHTTWSPEEEHILHQEAFYTEILKRRQMHESKAQEPLWRQILDSKLVLTLVTVVLGGVIGKMIVSSYQENAKEAALEVAEYREFVSKQQDIVQRAYDLLGKGASDSKDLRSLTQSTFEEKNIEPSYREAVHAQKQQMIERHEELLMNWVAEEYKTGLLLEYYHFEHPEVIKQWKIARDSVNKLRACSDELYDSFQHGNSGANRDSCQQQQQELQLSLDGLADAVGKAHQYTWQQFRLQTEASYEPKYP